VLKKLGLAMLMGLTLSAGLNAQTKVHKVAYIARAQADSFAAWLANSVQDEAKKYKDISLKVFDGQANDDTENSLIENAITNKFDVIIIQPNNGESQRPYAVKVVKAGIFCITTNARIAGIAGASSVDADPYEQAAVNARLALKQIPQNAKVVVLDGPPGNFHADSRRVSWQKEFFAKRPDVKIVGEQIANWNKDEAMNKMEDWVQANPKIDAIISMNDNMAAGAIEVVSIGMPPKILQDLDAQCTWLTAGIVRKWLPARTRDRGQNGFAPRRSIRERHHEVVRPQATSTQRAGQRCQHASPGTRVSFFLGRRLRAQPTPQARLTPHREGHLAGPGAGRPRRCHLKTSVGAGGGQRAARGRAQRVRAGSRVLLHRVVLIGDGQCCAALRSRGVRIHAVAHGAAGG